MAARGAGPSSQPDKTLLDMGAPGGGSRQWTLRRVLARRPTHVAAGLAARGVRQGDKVLIHADNCPEMVLAWYACAAVGAVGVTTNTRSVRPSSSSSSPRPGVSGPSPSPSSRRWWPPPAPTWRWIAVTDDDSGRAGPADAGGPTARALRRPAGDGDRGRAGPRPDGAVRDPVHVGHHLPAQGRGAHPRQRPVGRPGRSHQHLHGARRHLPGLPPLLPRQRPELVLLDDPGRRRHHRAAAQVLLVPPLGGRDSSTRSPTSRSSPSSTTPWPASPSRSTR